MSEQDKDYPVQLDIKYPEKLHRVKTLFRMILIIPILFILTLVAGTTINISGGSPHNQNTYSSDTNSYYNNQLYVDNTNTVVIKEYVSSSNSHNFIKNTISAFTAMLFSIGGYVFLAPLLIILFRKKYPKWWFNWNVELVKFQLRVTAYFYLLTDTYPSTEDQEHLVVNVEYPTPEKLNRGLPLVKWFLAIPHYVILMILSIINIFVIIAAWICIIITGHYPKSLFNYCVGVMRWSLRVTCYAILLTTDKYPPFRLFS